MRSDDEQPAGGAIPPAGSAFPRLTRRRFLALAVAGSAGLAGEGLGWGPRRLGVSHHALSPRPTTAGRPVRMIQISDLHLHGVGAMHRRMADEVRRLRPDLLLFTGDAVDRADRLGVLAELLALLPRGVPGFAILGNWEHWADVDLGALEALYARAGTRLLVNQTVVQEVRGARLVITGLDDLAGGEPDVARALAGAPAGDAHLLLAHCPEQRDRLSRVPARAEPGSGSPPEFDWTRITAMLAGHTHGGQVKLGGWAPVTPPGSGRYVDGWYREAGGVPMYVSRGIGTSMAPVRFGCPPELAVFDWWPDTRVARPVRP